MGSHVNQSSYNPDRSDKRIPSLENAQNIQNTNSWAWRVFTEKQNLADTSTFFLGIYRPGEVKPRFSSVHFRILRPSPASTQTGTLSSSVSTPSPSPSSLPGDPGLNSRTKTELGLGLGIGSLWVLGMGILLGYFLHSGRRNAAGDDYHEPIVGDIGTLPSAQQAHGQIAFREMGLMEGRELDSQALQELDLGTQLR